ncbi:AfsR/SARP family transcriptional regulator [Acrocarpospora catenulata]|uniref:AfsR/SARP family transcriptional regulator n=1 Tax=Acrocarpospora catenulata TaxID=2836182 RepID=UPI001BDA81AD|nr:AfsR/SARP family transcriptional regulator [Acrocarpospora catenulata]
MRLEALGPLTVTVAGETVAIRSGKQRALLAILLAQAGRHVSPRRLTQSLWDEPPASAAENLRLHLYYLRRALGDPDRVVREPAGLRLVVRPGEVDLADFDRLARDGDHALAQGRPERAGKVYAEALALWRGPAYGELAEVQLVRESVLRLNEARLRVIEQRITADLALGRHAVLVAELIPLVAEHPLRERLRAHLMRALDRCGRRADALEVYRVGRQTLVREQGLEPGPELRAVHDSILREEVTPESDRRWLASPPRSGAGCVRCRRAGRRRSHG